jgi:hypothetical protein
MALRPPEHDPSPALRLPFGGLGLDLALVRRKVAGLRLLARPLRQVPKTRALPAPPPRLSGYSLLLRLRREIRGC